MKGDKSVACLFASFFYTGYLPYAPGTWASLVAVILWFIIPWNSLLFRLSLIFAVLLIGTFVSGIVEKRSGERDPSFIVIDEVAGMWLTLALLPKMTFPENIGRIIFAFFAFRFFDILKVPPIKKLESIHGGLGIMLDDIIAGIYAGTLVNIFTLVF